MRATTAALESMMSNLIAAGAPDADPPVPAGVLNGAKLHLYQTFDGASEPTVSDFGEADYSGYTAGGVDITWTGPVLWQDNSVGLLFTETFAGATDTPTVSNTVQGYYVTDSTGDDLLLWGQFPAPAVMNGATSFLPVEIELAIQPALPIGTEEAG